MDIKIFSFLLVLSLSTQIRCQTSNLSAIECPFPHGSDPYNEALCNQYTACQFDGNQCHMRSNEEVGYQIVSAHIDTARGYTKQLERISTRYSLFEYDIEQLTFEVILHEDYHLQIKITDSNEPRYEVPVPLNLPSSPESFPMYTITTSEIGMPFWFQVNRSSNGNTIFQSVGPLTFEEQFIQISTKLSSTDMYGFGESTHTELRRQFDPRQTFAIFSRDQPVGPGEVNEYGHHPYYMLVEDQDGNSDSVLFFNSNAGEYSTFMLNDVTPALTYRVIGGILDMHFFLGPTPEDLNKQYTNMIGRPAFPPYWALGFQLSRWGYQNTDEIRELRDRTRAENIPQDVQVLDIDYMNGFRDFTIDPVDFADVSQLVQELHQENIKVVIILDPAIVIDEDYTPFSQGVTQDVFIKWPISEMVPQDQPIEAGDYVVGYVWPENKTVFPDFLKPETEQWWHDLIVDFHNVIEFDALWIDMNEPANFGTDMDHPWNWPEGQADWSLKCPYNRLDSPPYPTKTTYTGSTESFRLSDHTICMSSIQTDGMTVYDHYDVHSLYGWSQSRATYRSLESLLPGKRPLVLSRSTFPGSGKYAVHWLGDNTANDDSLQMSVIGMIEFSMFGISYTGADVCGFFGEPSMELCARWTEVGAFYPFNRNHNALGSADNIQNAQDPAMWPEVAAIARKFYNLRYQYHPYLYYLLYQASATGSTVVRPLYNVFPTDLGSRSIQDQFFWGDGIMIAPILEAISTNRDVYFPPGIYYDLITGSLGAIGPTTLNMDILLDEMPLYVRGGAILPFQEPALTTTESRLNAFGLTIAIDESGDANGAIFWDDGESAYQDPLTNAYEATVTYTANTLTLTVEHDPAMVSGLNIETLKFYGYPTEPTEITVASQVIDSTAWTYDDTNNVLVVTLSELLGVDFVVNIV